MVPSTFLLNRVQKILLLIFVLLSGCSNARTPPPPEEKQAIFLKAQKKYSIGGVSLGTHFSELQAIVGENVELEAKGFKSFRLYDNRMKGGILFSLNDLNRVVYARSLGSVRLFLPDGKSIRRRELLDSLGTLQLPTSSDFDGGRIYFVPDGTLKLFISDETVRTFVLETNNSGQMENESSLPSE